MEKTNGHKEFVSVRLERDIKLHATEVKTRYRVARDEVVDLRKGAFGIVASFPRGATEVEVVLEYGRVNTATVMAPVEVLSFV